MKKGFTLIELLAVIVILAIIALIATPIILGIIEDARKGSIEASANGYIDAVEYKIARNEIKGEETTSGIYEVSELDIDIDGEKPTSGYVTINKGKVEEALLCINDNSVELKNNKIKIVGNCNSLYKEELLNGADPVLKDELIPVNIASDGSLMKADTNMKWYSYENKEWANAVILEEKEVNKIKDISGNGNDGEVFGNLKEGYGYASFDGVDDYINIIDKDDVELGNSFSIMLKFLYKSDTYGRLIMGKGLDLYIIDNNLACTFAAFDDSGNVVYPGLSSLNNDFEEDKVYDLVINYDGSIFSAYANGKLINKFSTNKSAIKNSKNFIIGNFNSKYFNSNIYYASISKDSLTDKELEEYFEKGTISNKEKLIFEYDFNDAYSDVTKIEEDDVEAYYVWVPKYSYKLFDLGNYTTYIDSEPTDSKAKTIDIKFGLDNTNDKNTGECTTPMISGETGNCEVNDYMTHPAFLSMDTTGFWTSKFEATGTLEDITSKPNKPQLNTVQLKYLFESAYKYRRNLDSHMMKNTEWGAIAYLSHSKYGINKDVNINNHQNVLTGYSGTDNALQVSYPGTYGTTDDITQLYNTKVGYKASTTGNITGVYDMAGGGHEYVAAYIEGYYGSSGFDSESISVYDKKYFDFYNSNSTWLGFNYRILGDATGELGPVYSYSNNNTGLISSSWYKDFSMFVSKNRWFIRGHSRGDSFITGQFSFSAETGRGYGGIRIVLN